MPNDIAIRVENLGKMYHIGREVKRAANTREAIERMAMAPFRYTKDMIRHNRYMKSLLRGQLPDGRETVYSDQDSVTDDSPEYFWALRNVSFEVKRGEVIGIIGRNGAGKSTLLKILSRITDPTTGFAEIHGRVNSLLEVGTGFHPELTGRENIYMAAALHGMKKAEIDRKFDEIVDFAGVEKFIDTPVKRYSSGMSVRLGFAVAANLEPDVLIVDEVLAVGDAEFQKKCLGKMGNVARDGRTVFLVSHNMQAISTLANRCYLFNKGQLQHKGAPRDVVSKYLSSKSDVAEKKWGGEDAPGDDSVKITSVKILNSNGDVTANVNRQCPFSIEMEFLALKENMNLNVGFHIYDQNGICVFAPSDLSGNAKKVDFNQYGRGRYTCSLQIPACFMNNGKIFVTAVVVEDKMIQHARAEQAVSFNLDDYGDGRGGYSGLWIGAVRPEFPWVIERKGELE